MGSINPFKAPTVTNIFTGFPIIRKTQVEKTMKKLISQR